MMLLVSAAAASARLLSHPSPHRRESAGTQHQLTRIGISNSKTHLCQILEVATALHDPHIRCSGLVDLIEVVVAAKDEVDARYLRGITIGSGQKDDSKYQQALRATMHVTASASFTSTAVVL